METVNMVATVKVSQAFDLVKIRKSLPNTEYTFSSATWLKMRLLPEGYYIAFYKSGKFLITGVKSIDIVKSIADRVISLLKNSGIEIDDIIIKIHNVVFMDSLNKSVNLENLIYNLDTNKAVYEPEQFPGLIYKDGGATFLLFPSGKVIITGLTEKDEALRLFDHFKKIINN